MPEAFLETLNEAQRAAVLHGDGPLLVFAGAGSGKTRAITCRIAHLVAARGVAPWAILAVTFTNKAAGEMRERLEGLLGDQAREVHVSTFHAAAAAILRREAEALSLTRSFTIYDEDDQLSLVKRVMRELGLDERSVSARAVAHRIDRAKNFALSPDELEPHEGDLVGLAAKKVYRVYEAQLARADAVDFGGLLLSVVRLFRKRDDILSKYRRRFTHLLVDEFQDTNPVQYELLRLLGRDSRSVCVVGDDDQSIYRWRGADVQNVLRFERDFPGAGVVKLERNYRSDAGILQAAHAVISKNLRRKEKKLWTDRPQGAPLGLLIGRDERGEASEIARAIRKLGVEEVPYSQIAVFYRVNAQSRVLEEGLRQTFVPYVIVRGRSFYERAEVKDAVAYLRLMVNPHSDADLLRAIQTPPRGIGDATVEKLTQAASRAGHSLYRALAQPEAIEGLGSAAVKRLRQFRGMFDELIERTATLSAEDAVTAMLSASGLVEHLLADGSPEAVERIENLRELAGAAKEHDRLRAEELELEPAAAEGHSENEGGGQGQLALGLPGAAAQSYPGPLAPAIPPLADFLQRISLQGDADGVVEGGRVSLMTLHAAKGLEFDAVFMTGMEEGVFPHGRALAEGADPEELAEERRLCYVGITRARKRLALSLARQRSLFGEQRQNPASRFLSDIPPDLFEQAAAREAPVSRPAPRGVHVDSSSEFDQSASSGALAGDLLDGSVVGRRVRHGTFGEGEVRSLHGEGPEARITVFFPSVGTKRIVARFLTFLS